MTELTDLEICKRIAEIEGTEVFMYQHIIYGNVLCRKMTVGGIAPQPYNPLTDDALNHRLMIKYKISLIAPEGEQKDWDCVISHVLTVNANPNKAICLAIIEANK